MDFFGFGSSADLNSPIGMLIKSATDPLLVGPDWSKLVLFFIVFKSILFFEILVLNLLLNSYA